MPSHYLCQFWLINWGVLCQKHISRARTSNYIPQYLWDVITCLCPWYLLLIQHSSIGLFEIHVKENQIFFLQENAFENFFCKVLNIFSHSPLQWRHNERDGVSNHQPHHCLLNCLFRRRSKKTSKLHVIGLCAGNSLVTSEFPTQMASNAENVSIWWRHHECVKIRPVLYLSTSSM